MSENARILTRITSGTIATSRRAMKWDIDRLRRR